MQYYGRQYPAGLDSKPSGRKEIIGIRKGANACILYLTGRNTHRLQLKTIAQRQVDVPLLSHDGNLLHREALLGKSIIDLLPHLKVADRDARTNDGQQILRLAAIGLCHCRYSPFHNTGPCSSPACMDGTGAMTLCIIQQDGDAIGRGDPDTDLLLICHHGIDTLQESLAVVVSQRKEGFAYLPHLCAMHLMGHHKA